MNRAARSSKSMGTRRIFALEIQNRWQKISKGQKLVQRFFSENFWPRVESFQTTF